MLLSFLHKKVTKEVSIGEALRGVTPDTQAAPLRIPRPFYFASQHLNLHPDRSGNVPISASMVGSVVDRVLKIDAQQKENKSSCHLEQAKGASKDLPIYLLLSNNQVRRSLGSLCSLGMTYSLHCAMVLRTDGRESEHSRPYC